MVRRREEEKKKLQVFFHGIWGWSKDVDNNKLQDLFLGIQRWPKDKKKGCILFFLGFNNG